MLNSAIVYSCGSGRYPQRNKSRLQRMTDADARLSDLIVMSKWLRNIFEK